MQGKLLTRGHSSPTVSTEAIAKMKVSFHKHLFEIGTLHKLRRRSFKGLQNKEESPGLSLGELWQMEAKLCVNRTCLAENVFWGSGSALDEVNEINVRKMTNEDILNKSRAACFCPMVSSKLLFSPWESHVTEETFIIITSQRPAALLIQLCWYKDVQRWVCIPITHFPLGLSAIIQPQSQLQKMMEGSYDGWVCNFSELWSQVS